MNKVTKAEREKIISRAMEIVRLGDKGQITNGEAAVKQLRSELGISRDRARSAVATAARRKRYPRPAS